MVNILKHCANITHHYSYIFFYYSYFHLRYVSLSFKINKRIHTCYQEPLAVMIDKFVIDIREYSTSISGCRSPAAIIMFSVSRYSLLYT